MMNYNLSPDSYESIISMQQAEIEALRNRNQALEYLNRVNSNQEAVINAQAQTDAFIFKKLFS
jgi:hypothetical protein